MDSLNMMNVKINNPLIEDPAKIGASICQQATIEVKVARSKDRHENHESKLVDKDLISRKVEKLKEENRQYKQKRGAVKYMSKGDLVNLNGKVRNSSSYTKLVCRHIASSYALGIIGSKDIKFTPLKDVRKFKKIDDSVILDESKYKCVFESGFPMKEEYYFDSSLIGKVLFDRCAFLSIDEEKSFILLFNRACNGNKVKTFG